MLSLCKLMQNLGPLITATDGSQASFVVYGSALAALIAVVWALLERRERQASQQLNSELSLSVRQLIESHFRERLQSEERHLLTHDASMRNVFEHLESAILGKRKG